MFYLNLFLLLTYLWPLLSIYDLCHSLFKKHFDVKNKEGGDILPNFDCMKIMYVYNWNWWHLTESGDLLTGSADLSVENQIPTQFDHHESTGNDDLLVENDDLLAGSSYFLLKMKSQITESDDLLTGCDDLLIGSNEFWS